MFLSVVEDFLVLGATILIHKCLQSGVTWWLQGAREYPDFVCLVHGLEQIWTAVVLDVLELIVTGIVPEATIVQLTLIQLHWTSLIAKHKFLKRQEAKIPGI